MGEYESINGTNGQLPVRFTPHPERPKREPHSGDPRVGALLFEPVVVEVHEEESGMTRIEIGTNTAGSVQMTISPPHYPDIAIGISRDQLPVLASALMSFAPNGGKRR